MRKIFYLLVLIVSLSAFAKGPQIKFEKTLIDVGKVPIKTQLNVEFKFKNIGDEKLVIYMVKPG